MPEKITDLGPVMQLAYVPVDMAATARFWTDVVGAGPFFCLPHVDYDRVKYRGEVSQLDLSVMIGYWGDMQIELIEQHCATPSIYKSWRDEGREGLHHVCIIVDDIARARAVAAASALRVVQEFFLDGGELIYIDTGGGPGTMVEVHQPAPAFAGLCAMIRDAHRDWDGSNPVRSLV